MQAIHTTDNRQPVQAQAVMAQPVQAQHVQAQPVQAQAVMAQPVQAQAVMAQPVQAKPMQAQPMQPMQAQPMMAQPMQPQMQPQMQTIGVAVPQGVGPGMPFVVAVNGQNMQVTCPQGVGPGQMIQLQIQAPQQMVQQQMMQQQMVMPQQPGGGMQAPFWAQGLPPGGHMESEQFCGMITWLIGCFLFPFVCCCPCDSKQVYVSPDGRRVPEPKSC